LLRTGRPLFPLSNSSRRAYLTWAAFLGLPLACASLVTLYQALSALGAMSYLRVLSMNYMGFSYVTLIATGALLKNRRQSPPEVA
jgi:hypothetical protein